MWRYIQKSEKNQNFLHLHHSRMTLITTHVWKAVKFQQRQVETYGFHHWLELGKFFNLHIDFNRIDDDKLAYSRHWHTSRKSHYLRSKKKNCEPLKSWDIKIIPMTMENPNIALFFLISAWKIQCHKKKCPKMLFWTIFTPKTHLSLNRESWKLVCICNGVPSVCVPKIMRIGQFKGTQKWLKLAKICK